MSNLYGEYVVGQRSFGRITQTQGTSSDATYIILGNFSYCAILERQGLEIATSEHVVFANDQTAARATARSAIAITQPSAVTTIAGIRP